MIIRRQKNYSENPEQKEATKGKKKISKLDKANIWMAKKTKLKRRP